MKHARNTRNSTLAMVAAVPAIAEAEHTGEDGNEKEDDGIGKHKGGGLG